MYTPQSLLNITCSIKSRPRTVTLTRSNREEELGFEICGGNTRHPTAPAADGVFVSNVESNSPAAKHGLKRGDEVSFYLEHFLHLIVFRFFKPTANSCASSHSIGRSTFCASRHISV